MEKNDTIIAEQDIPMIDIERQDWWGCVTSVVESKDNTLEITYDKSRLDMSENEKSNPRTIIVPIHEPDEPSKENEFPSIHLKFKNEEKPTSFRVIPDDTELAKLAELFKKNKLGDEGCSHTIFLTKVCGKRFGNFDKKTEKNIIKVEANFSYCYFKEMADFNSSTFNHEANFWSSTFNHEANFWSSTFNHEANFRLSNFNNTAYFIESTFKHEAGFNYSTFSHIAFFWSSNFEDNAVFWSSTFNHEADFSSSNFKDTANFSSSTFNNTVDFISSTFKDTANFSSSTFNNTAYFWLSTFNHAVNFNSSTFREELNLSELLKVPPSIDISDAEIKFLNIKSSGVLVQLSLKGAQIEKIDFTGTTIASSPNRETFTVLKNIAIKQNDQISALDFYQKEMFTYFKELKWEWGNNLSRKFILWIESWVSKYGTSYLQAGIRIAEFNVLIIIFGWNPDLSHIEYGTRPLELLLFESMNIFTRFTLHDTPSWNGIINFFRLAGNAFLYYELIKSFRMFSRKL